MRAIIRSQLHLGQVDIGAIEFDLQSRDDIPQLLMGLQYIYVTPEIRKKVFSILEEMTPADVDRNNGRPGMELWNIFVSGCIRLDLNIDYDRLHELMNNHRTIRQMLGHGLFDEDYEYHLQTIKDNVSLLTPDLLNRINQIVVEAGHTLLKTSEDEPLKGRCDSFVGKTDVHFPTDSNLLFDAIRKVISLSAEQCRLFGLSDWRQYQYNINTIKMQLRKIGKLRKSTSKDEDKKKAKEEAIKEAHQVYLDLTETFMNKAANMIYILREEYGADSKALADIEYFLMHCYRQSDQIRRRVIEGETIPHDEKIFSVFEEHTEWISKGKAGVPVELGLRVCIVEDQHGFILHHRVMQKETDEKIAVQIIKETQGLYPNFTTCSFDKGFHSPSNQTELKKILDLVVLPKKGKLSIADKKRQGAGEFIEARRAHSAVESGINALQVHGLNHCPDHGIAGYKRYVALSIVGRNLQKLGAILQSHARKQKKLH